MVRAVAPPGSRGTSIGSPRKVIRSTSAEAAGAGSGRNQVHTGRVKPV